LANRCPQCKSSQLESRGPGTERLEQALTALFPAFPVIRIDRDTTQRKHAMRDKVAEIRQGQPSILVGTQMLAKGHHFPEVTLVVMVDLDGGLFSADLRGPERMGQVLTQVAGRAGRAQKTGRVLLQTHYPQHPLIEGLVRDDYQSFAVRLLAERQIAGAPPFAYFALLRADAKTLHEAESLLADLRAALTANGAANSAGVTCFGPLPAPMARRAGMFRAQLLLRAAQRVPLHRALDQLVRVAERHPAGRRSKWSIDVDPVDFS
jgi:primosomal protein N' (replication factor Y)